MTGSEGLVAKRYTRKPINQQPDEFISFWQKAYNAAIPYARPIALTLAGALGVVIAVWIADHFMTDARENATEQFDRSVRVAEADLITDASPAKSEDKIPRFKTEKERAEATLAEVDKVAGGSSAVAHRALLLKAGTLFDLGRFADAEASYKKFLDQVGSDDPLRFLAREGVGLCAEAQNKLDDALAAFKELDPKAGDFYRDRALFAQARVLMKKGDKKGAEGVYLDILKRVPKTPLKDEIETRLGALGAAIPPPAPEVPPSLPKAGGG
ncbi:MAG: tetratricopeptide repeat protein [Myxococcales bacterium]|nr:tetratricopeptide repeat protein [Myxococcales bacterium]